MTASLPDRPRLGSHLFAATIGDGDNVVLSEDRVWLWQSRGLGRLLSRLDGSRDLGELFEAVAPELSPPVVVHLLNRLRALGLLAGDAAGPFWDAMDLAPPLDGDAPVDVVTVAHYLEPELAEINAAALASGAPWMVCKLTGQTAWIGPIFVPGRTGCMRCLQDRLRAHRPLEDRVGELTPAAGASAALSRLGASWVAHELALWRAGDRSVEGRVLTISSGREGMDLVAHTLVRRPQCTACGDGGAALRSRSPRLALDAPPSAETAEATLRRLEAHVSPITGLVTSLRDVADDGEDVVHAYVARHPFALGPDTLRWRRRQLRFHAYGKGATDAQARISAIAEAIERHCGSFHGDVPWLRSTYAALADRAVHPATCLNFSADQFARRDELNAPGSGFFELVPRPFPEELEIDWMALWSLTDERVRHLPAALCYLGHPDVEKHFYCAGDPNGCAAGSTLAEAVLHAFLEVVERDSAAIWWYNRVRRPAVELDAFGDPYLQRVEDWHRRHDRELWALDITADLGIPVFAAVSRRVGGPTEDLLFAFGADLDPGRAIVRAVAEVNQFLPAVGGRTSDGATRYAWPDEHAVRFWQNETLQTQPQLAPAAEATPATTLRGADGDVHERLATCVQIAREQGLELLALDQTLPDAGLHVARVVVPGLRHFWRRLGPGRLYDVPVTLGWLPRPTPETELNRASVFY